MSIETLTGDEFVELTIEEHEEALAIYADAVSTNALELARLESGTNAHEQCLDTMARRLTLRKVHLARLAEMKEEEEPASVPASEQYRRNELAAA